MLNNNNESVLWRTENNDLRLAGKVIMEKPLKYKFNNDNIYPQNVLLLKK